MFIPAHHAETDPSILRQFVRENRLGIFTTAIPGTSSALLQASHIPWLLDYEQGDDAANLGKLRGHMSR
jgi:transcriptional regulator